MKQETKELLQLLTFLIVVILGIGTVAFIIKQNNAGYERDYAAQPTFEIIGTGITFKDGDYTYRCRVGVTYVVGSDRVPSVILLDENGKPRPCHSI